ncbi:hypothetical protein JW758_00465 [Candidatus Peregrinibacteria bacterium]|nr:hypothetical protein [Candidatus Peregrinibacteria bacterium]
MPNCKQCNQGFEISNEENALREKLTGDFETGLVPQPTQCLVCRMRRKMAWRNEMTLYKRDCDKTGKSIISIYPSNTDFPVYSKNEWWGNDWDAMSYGREFDFSRPFFEQFVELFNKVPKLPLISVNTENSDYCNFIWDSRNSYLSYCIYKSESLIHCYWLYHSRDCIDCSYCFRSERCYECTDCNDSQNSKFCILSHNCSDSLFLYDCRGCSNCFGCVGLRNKKYYMFNQKLPKDEYEKRLKGFDLQKQEHIDAVKTKLNALRLKLPHRYSIQDKTENCTGDYIFESKDCHNCYQLYNGRDCINVEDSDCEDCQDSYHIGWASFIYDSYSVCNNKSSAFSIQCDGGSDLFYSYCCYNLSHGFGCDGIRQNEYCILNKKYSKEQYQELLPKIVEHMRGTGEWGEFFPAHLSPFAYNESVIPSFYPLEKDEVLRRKWRWKDDLPFTKGKESISHTELSENISDIPLSVTNEIFACDECGKNYKIIDQELRYYKNENLPLPKNCPHCRNANRLKFRNPRRLFSRKCDKCGESIRSSYSLERPEIVYCESCYLKEVY